MKSSDKFALYYMLLLIFSFLFYCLFKLIVWQYEAYNERRGYCTAEGKYLTEEEKLRNLKADIFVIQLENIIREKNHGWYVNDNKIFVSKYNLRAGNEIIELIKKVDINKSFEENFGLVAVATVEEYINRRECLIKNRWCLNIDRSRKGLRSLWKEDNSIDVEYLKNIPQIYSMVTGSVSIYPLSSLKKIDKHTYSIESYRLDPRCCDKEIIHNAFNGYGFWGVKRNDSSKIKANEEINALSVEQLKGKSLSYINDLYKGHGFNNIKEVQHYGMLLSVASLRSDNYPQVNEISINACGIINKKDRFSL